MTRVVAVRHGETEWNRTGRMQGWAPTVLNETGREQARAAGEWLVDEYTFDAVYASDLDRTRETADLILDAFEADFDVTHEPHWRERDIGVYQGFEYGEVLERFPKFSLGEAAYEASMAVPEGGESLRDVADRVTQRLGQVVSNHDDETVLVVTHGGPLHLMLGYAKDLPLLEGLKRHHQDNCGINEFAEEGDGLRVVRENERPWV
ncbi:histidine phosphatase family protein [Natronomonas sp.]|uniref:histidine phosphatase family protein n=1 Tax=Natronomonas sp. TaxID=2184060 RepID=UPI002FC2CB87